MTRFWHAVYRGKKTGGLRRPFDLFPFERDQLDAASASTMPAPKY
jgi:hypothetical protein